MVKLSINTKFKLKSVTRGRKMSEIKNIDNYENQIYYKQKEYLDKIKINKFQKNKNLKKDTINIKNKNDSTIIKNNYKKGYKKREAIKRPIKIDNSNNMFFINYKGENKTVKIKPGNYTLTEISLSIQKKVNENFGIGKVKLKLTGSISDGFIHAEEDKTNKFYLKK